MLTAEDRRMHAMRAQRAGLAQRCRIVCGHVFVVGFVLTSQYVKVFLLSDFLF